MTLSAFTAPSITLADVRSSFPAACSWSSACDSSTVPSPPHRHQRSVHRLRQPLAGALYPSWAPPLHAAVALVDRAGDRALVVDFLPTDATAPVTLAAMLAGRAVPATARRRVVQWPLRGGGIVTGERLGESARSNEEVQWFVEGFSKDIRLYVENCYHFEEAFLGYLLVSD